jgi:hypothetical protein
MKIKLNRLYLPWKIQANLTRRKIEAVASAKATIVYITDDVIIRF